MPPKNKLAKVSFSTRVEPWMPDMAAKLIRDMTPMRQVAGYLGVSPPTLSSWIRMGEDPGCTDPILVELAVAVARARAESVTEGMKMLRPHAERDYRALMEILRASDPDTWVQTAKVKNEVEVTTKPSMDFSKLSDEEFAVFERLATKALPTGEDD